MPYPISGKGKYMSCKNHGKRRFTEREKRAFSAGKGYAAAKAGKRVACKTEKEKASFRNGVKAVRNRKGGKGGARCENCGYFVDANGEVFPVRK